MSNPVLNRRLTLEAPQQAADGAGGYIETWAALGVLWGEVKPGTGREISGEGTALTRVSYRITVRGAPMGAPSRPKPEQRFREGTRLFHILAVTERDPRGLYLTCFAEEELGA